MRLIRMSQSAWHVYTCIYKIDASPRIDELHSAIIRKVVILGQATGCSLPLGLNGTRGDGSNAQTWLGFAGIPVALANTPAVPFIPIV